LEKSSSIANKGLVVTQVGEAISVDFADLVRFARITIRATTILVGFIAIDLAVEARGNDGVVGADTVVEAIVRAWVQRNDRRWYALLDGLNSRASGVGLNTRSICKEFSEVGNSGRAPRTIKSYNKSIGKTIGTIH